MEDVEGALHAAIRVGGSGTRDRESRELREFRYQRLERADFARNQCGALAKQLGQLGGIRWIAAPVEITYQALDRKLDRRQRVLDFVSYALRDFLPGSRLLGAKQFGKIVDD